MATSRQRIAWQPPPARLEGDRLLKARNARIAAIAEVARELEMEAETTDEKIESLRSQLSDLRENLPQIISGGGGGRRMVERIFTRDGDKLINQLMTETISKSNAQFDKRGHAYGLNATDTDVATLIKGDLTATHTAPKALLHLEQVNYGCGVQSGPERAGYTFSAAAFKEGFLSGTAAPGEIDTTLLTFRQDNGDAACILGNGVINDGFGAFAEALTYAINPTAPYDYKHGIHVHIASINDRVGGEQYGYTAIKEFGTGGSAFYAATSGSGGWAYGLHFRHNNKTQFVQRVSDAALIQYEYDNPADYVIQKVVSGQLQFTNSAGDIVSPKTPAAVDYTPAATAGSGTITSATVTGRYRLLPGKRVHVSIRCTIVNNGTGANVLEFTLPFTAVTNGVYSENWLGRNLSTGVPVYGLLGSGSTKVQIILANNTYPVTTGDILWISGEYEMA